MFRLTHISTKNFRGLTIAAPIPLKKISLLIGRNSGGKSTFARIFPLLRQSVRARRRSPILWYGNLVDFGSFEDVCNRREPDGSINFNFGLQYDAPSTSSTRMADPQRLKATPGLFLTASLALRNSNANTFLSGVTIEIGEQKLYMLADQNGFLTKVTCGSIIWNKNQELEAFMPDGNLFPAPVFFQIENNTNSKKHYSQVEAPFSDELLIALKPFVHGNTNDKKLIDIANQLPLGSPYDLRKALEAELHLRGLRINCTVLASDPNVIKLADALLLYKLNSLLDAIDTDLSNYFNGVRYLKPLRATAQRYYRQQELAVDEVDPLGANIANVLTSLNTGERKQLTKWASEYLDFSIETISNGGHVSVVLKQSGATSATNLADMGFGFSQILPILVQLWLSSNQAKRRGLRAARQTTTSIIIEQPELHLHPAFQAKLADLFVARGKFEEVKPPNLIIETHSPALVNRFGELIHKNLLSPDDIQIILFEPDNSHESSTVRVTTYDEKGFLKDWPYGFFEPDSE